MKYELEMTVEEVRLSDETKGKPRTVRITTSTAYRGEPQQANMSMQGILLADAPKLGAKVKVTVEIMEGQ